MNVRIKKEVPYNTTCTAVERVTMNHLNIVHFNNKKKYYKTQYNVTHS